MDLITIQTVQSMTKIFARFLKKNLPTYLRSSYTLLLLYTAIIQTTLQHSISKYSNSIHTQDEIDTVVLIGPVCVYLRRGKTSSFLQQNIHGKNLRQAAKTFFFFGIDSSKQASTVG